MTSKIYLEQVREIIINRLKGYEIELFLFGSQTRGESSQPSDIDVGVLPKQPLPQNLLSEIREELEESNIPYPVELIYLSKVSHKFARNVKEEGIPWHQGKKNLTQPKKL